MGLGTAHERSYSALSVAAENLQGNEKGLAEVSLCSHRSLGK